MASVRKRIVRALPGWAWWLLQQRPHITTYCRYMRRIDEMETAAYLRGLRAARSETLVADLTARIDAGPTRPRRSAVRVTSTGAALRAITGRPA